MIGCLIDSVFFGFLFRGEWPAPGRTTAFTIRSSDIEPGMVPITRLANKKLVAGGIAGSAHDVGLPDLAPISFLTVRHYGFSLSLWLSSWF
jgi:hypothetical protein